MLKRTSIFKENWKHQIFLTKNNWNKKNSLAKDYEFCPYLSILWIEVNMSIKLKRINCV